jgi:hypothetical protein
MFFLITRRFSASSIPPRSSLDPLGEGRVAHAIAGLEELDEADDRLDRFFFEGGESGILDEEPCFAGETWWLVGFGGAPKPNPAGDC